jgi:hypothetical protein
MIATLIFTVVLFLGGDVEAHGGGLHRWTFNPAVLEGESPNWRHALKRSNAEISPGRFVQLSKMRL